MEKASDCNCCCCQENELPEAMMTSFDAPLCFDDSDVKRFLTVSLGIFSIVRIVRSAQYLIQATEYAIPEKECIAVEEDDPCHVFRSMPFPMSEFSSQEMPMNSHHQDRSDRSGSCRCGC